MIFTSQDFSDTNRIHDIALFLKHELNISDGRNILLLMNDKHSKSNLECLERWTRQKVWSELREEGFVELERLSNDLLKLLNENQENSNCRA